MLLIMWGDKFSKCLKVCVSMMKMECFVAQICLTILKLRGILCFNEIWRQMVDVNIFLLMYLYLRKQTTLERKHWNGGITISAFCRIFSHGLLKQAVVSASLRKSFYTNLFMVFIFVLLFLVYILKFEIVKWLTKNWVNHENDLSQEMRMAIMKYVLQVFLILEQSVYVWWLLWSKKQKACRWWQNCVFAHNVMLYNTFIYTWWQHVVQREQLIFVYASLIIVTKQST